MKKSFLIISLALTTLMGYAQSYGILVNSKTYFAAEYKGPDPYGEGFEEYLAHVQIKAGDYCQLYDVNNKAAWAVGINTASVAGFTFDAGQQRYNATVTGCYDFYIKLKWEADELYIGNGSNCGNGQNIDDVKPGYNTAAPAQCTDVMFQCFYWDSYKDNGYGITKWLYLLGQAGDKGNQLEEIGQWFDLVWLPPFSKATGGTGYLPIQYSNLSGQWGQKNSLEQVVYTLHKNGAKVVADIVANHVAGSNGWCTFAVNDFGTYGKFEPTAAWICKTDEMNFDSNAGDCKGKATGADDDGYGSEANYDSGRDWDHNNSQVRDMFKAYLKWLRNEIGIDGFRYDYCKGFHNSHINEYNSASGAYFSVMEMWDGNPDVLQSHLNDAGWNTLTFDFATKYQAFNNGIAADNYGGLKGAGLLGAGKSRYAVTFLDSHDSFQRDDNEFCGYGNSMKYPGKIQQCYAYLLSMPGVPLVFYPHWVKFKDKIKPMINARYKTGVHSESAVSDEAGNGFYKATITGTNGEIRVLIGPNSGYNSTPSGYTLAVKGENYGVYFKMTTPRGDKNTERKPQAIDEVTTQNNSLRGEKFMENGQLFIRCGEQVFDALGRRVK